MTVMLVVFSVVINEFRSIVYADPAKPVFPLN